MTQEEILRRVVGIIRTVMPETKTEDLTRDTVVNRDMGLDSLQFIMVICKIEGEFGIEIPDRRWMKLQTLGEVADTVSAALEKKKK